jgi:hypothetical protein
VVLGVARMAVGRVVDYTLPSVWREVEMGGWNGMGWRGGWRREGLKWVAFVYMAWI